jgi:hypothetical protein
MGLRARRLRIAALALSAPVVAAVSVGSSAAYGVNASLPAKSAAPARAHGAEYTTEFVGPFYIGVDRVSNTERLFTGMIEVNPQTREQTCLLHREVDVTLDGKPFGYSMTTQAAHVQRGRWAIVKPGGGAIPETLEVNVREAKLADGVICKGAHGIFHPRLLPPNW